MKSLFLPVMHEIKTWKIVIGFFIISIFYILGSFLFGIFCSSIPICSFSNGLGRTPLNLLFVLFTFVPIWVGVWVAGLWGAGNGGGGWGLGCGGGGAGWWAVGVSVCWLAVGG